MGNRLNIIDTAVGALVPTSGVTRVVQDGRIATNVPVGEQLASILDLYNFSSSFSLSAWYYQTADNDINYIVAYELTGDYKYYLHVQSDSWNAKFTVQDDLTNGITAEFGASGYNNGEWVFLVGVYNAQAGTVGVSVNGATLVTEPISNPIIDKSGGTLYVGRSGNSTVDFYVDDICIHGRALTQTEIELLYNGGNGREFPFG